MAKSIKLKNDYFLDSRAIVHNKNNLNELLNVKESSLNLANSKCKDVTANVLRKQLNIVTLDFEANAYFEGGYNLVGTIPSNFIPKVSNYFTEVLVYFVVEISGMLTVAFGRINKNGEVQIYNDPSKELIGKLNTGQQFRIHCVYFN